MTQEIHSCFYHYFLSPLEGHVVQKARPCVGSKETARGAYKDDTSFHRPSASVKPLLLESSDSRKASAPSVVEARSQPGRPAVEF